MQLQLIAQSVLQVFLGSYVIKFRQLHEPRTSQVFDRHIKIINLKYLMHFQLN